MNERPEYAKELLAEIRELNTKFVGLNMGDDLHLAARVTLAERPVEEVIKLAANYLVDLIKDEDRDRALAVERASVRTQRRPRKGSAAHREWLKEPANAAYEASLEEIDRKCESNLVKALSSHLEQYAKEIKLEWTEELLSTGFALGDGTTVTWGEATVEQHEQRRQIFLDNAVANLEGAGRHEKAIQELRVTGARNLRSLIEEISETKESYDHHPAHHAG